MTRVRVHNFSISLDGFGTGEPQSLEQPFGHAGHRMHEWMIKTAAFAKMIGEGSGTYGIANDLSVRASVGVGATIMGRNMFSPHRGPWQDHSWVGWWGPNPPYHHPTYVMTHYPRPALEMEGGTTFHFVTGTPQEVLALATEAANGQDVNIQGGVSTVRAFLREGLIDEAHIAITPHLIGRGENLWQGLDETLDRLYIVQEMVSADNIVHLRLIRRPAS